MKIRFIFITLLAAGIIISACSGLPGTTGTLEGKVAIGPISPVEQVGATPALLPAEAYTSRGIEILKGGKDDVYKTVHFNADGSYSVSLPAGNYTVRQIADEMYLAKDLPTSVKITAGEVTTLDISIDTGIR